METPRKKLVAGLATGMAAWLGLLAAPAQADTGVKVIFNPAGAISKVATKVDVVLTAPPTKKCKRGDGSDCAWSDLATPGMKQIVVLSAGYTDVTKFWTDFDEVVNQMGGPASGNSWSVLKKNQLMYVGYFTGGGPTKKPTDTGPSTASFGAAVATHPVRGYALTVDQQAVISFVENRLKSSLPHLRPASVAILMDSDQAGVTANAAPPTFLHAGYPSVFYGIAKFTHHDLYDRPGYIVTHELAHATLNFLDEYIEQATKDLNVSQLDAFTGLIQLNGTWSGFVLAIQNLLGVFTIKFSDILANNGSGHLANTRYPALVATSGFPGLEYGTEGGMFFGKGTFRQSGKDIMASGGEFAYDHTPQQKASMESQFGQGAQRPNDHVRTVGPNSWPFNFGQSTQVMWFDGHKNSIAQPTISYKVKVGWNERHWHTCWALFIPYPCYDDVWSEASKTVTPQRRSIDLRLTTVYNLATALQTLLCEMGLDSTLKDAIGGIDVCAQPLATVAANFLPTFVFPLPYEFTEAPTTQWMTTYYWKVQTNNGKYISGYTGWSSFFRSF